MKISRDMLIQALTRLGELAAEEGEKLEVCLYGGAVMMLGLVVLKRHRRRILGLPPLDLEQSFTRTRLDTHLITQIYKLPSDIGRRRNSVFIDVNFFWDANLHVFFYL